MKIMIAIINASPLIYLGQIGALSSLPKLFSECYTTSFVKNEILSQKNVPEHPILEESFGLIAVYIFWQPDAPGK